MAQGVAERQTHDGSGRGRAADTSASSASTLPNRTLGHSPARRPASSLVCEHMGAQLAQKCRTTGSVPPPLSACSSAAVATACKQRDHTHPLARVSLHAINAPQGKVWPQRSLRSEILPRPRPVPSPRRRRCRCCVRAHVPRHRVPSTLGGLPAPWMQRRTRNVFCVLFFSVFLQRSRGRRDSRSGPAEAGRTCATAPRRWGLVCATMNVVKPRRRRAPLPSAAH